MWRLAILSMGLLSFALAACDPSLFAGNGWGDGDYEVVALMAE